MSKSAKFYETHSDLAKSLKRPVPFKRARYSGVMQERRMMPRTRSMPANYLPREAMRVTPRELGIEEPEAEPEIVETPFYLRD